MGIFTGVDVNFEENGYSVSEDQSPQDVCVVLLGSIEVNVTVILSAEEDSTLPEDMRATRKVFRMLQLHHWIFNVPLHTVGSDFTMFMESELVFPPNNAPAALCRPIPVVSDDFAEETELFLIRLSSTNINVVPGSPVQVTILDQDSEEIHVYTKTLFFTK